jgi:hypothetical protein
MSRSAILSSETAGASFSYGPGRVASARAFGSLRSGSYLYWLTNSVTRCIARLHLRRLAARGRHATLVPASRRCGHGRQERWCPRRVARGRSCYDAASLPDTLGIGFDRNQVYGAGRSGSVNRLFREPPARAPNRRPRLRSCPGSQTVGSRCSGTEIRTRS